MESRTEERSRWRRDAVFVLPLLTVIAALYARALSVPWYQDDYTAIVWNPASHSVPLALHGLIGPRGIAYLSFALDQAVFGGGPTGPHAVNVAIHLANCAFVYALLRRLVPEGRSLAAAGALLFGVHPLQTQAVDLAVQRMTILATFFFFASLLLFFRARDLAAASVPLRAPKHLATYGSSLLLAAAAVLTKQNTIVFPAVFLVGDLLLGRAAPGAMRARLRHLTPFFILAIALAIQQLLPRLTVGTNGHFLDSAFEPSIVGYAGPSEPLRDPTPLRYFVTELSVLWEYARLVVIPWGQSIEHGYPLVAGYFTLRNLLAALATLVLAAIPVVAGRRLPALSFGIALVLLGLSVESSVIPLDTLVEHRMYLPMLGIVLVCLEGLRRVPSPKLQVAIVVAVLLPLAVLTWRRTDLWTRPVDFFEEALQTYPRNPRLWVLLSEALRDRGDHVGGKIALGHALELLPRYPAALENLARAEEKEGDYLEAERLHRRALSIDPDFGGALRGLAVNLLWQRRTQEALDAFAAAARKSPDDLRSLYYEAVLSAQLGDRERAARVAAKIEAIDPEIGELVDEMIGRWRRRPGSVEK